MSIFFILEDIPCGTAHTTVAHNCHGKTKNLTAKPKTSRQNQNTPRQNQKPHGKTKYFTAKTKYPTAKANAHGKTKAILLTLNRGVFGFAVRYFVFAVWFHWFCRDTVVGHHTAPI